MPNYKNIQEGLNVEKLTIKDSGMQVIDYLRNIFDQMPPEMSDYAEKVMKSLDKQEEKLNDASLTPSGLIVDQLKNSNKRRFSAQLMT